MAHSVHTAERELARTKDLLASHARVHELIARAAPLEQVLTELVAGIERYDGSVIPCAVLLDPESNTLHPGAGPSLPPEYLAAIDGVVIGPEVGSCGAAAWSGRMMITEARHVRGAHRAVARRHVPGAALGRHAGGDRLRRGGRAPGGAAGARVRTVLGGGRSRRAAALAAAAVVSRCFDRGAGAEARPGPGARRQKHERRRALPPVTA